MKKKIALQLSFPYKTIAQYYKEKEREREKVCVSARVCVCA